MNESKTQSNSDTRTKLIMCCQLNFKEWITLEGIHTVPIEQVQDTHRPNTILTDDLL